MEQKEEENYSKLISQTITFDFYTKGKEIKL